MVVLAGAGCFNTAGRTGYANGNGSQPQLLFVNVARSAAALTVPVAPVRGLWHPSHDRRTRISVTHRAEIVTHRLCIT